MTISDREAYLLATDLLALIDDGHTVTLTKELDELTKVLHKEQYVVIVDGDHYTGESLQIAVYKVFTNGNKFFPDYDLGLGAGFFGYEDDEL
jgi:hypothetical protein